MTAEEAVRDIVVPVSESLHGSSINDHEVSLTEEIITGDLIDLSTWLPPAPITNVNHIDVTTPDFESKDPTLSMSTADYRSAPSETACSSSPSHVELMMYAMVKELYHRSFS